MLERKLTVVTLLLFFSASCASQTTNTATTPSTSQARNSVDVVKVNAHPVEIKPGSTADAIVDITIERGYHVNANPPTFQYLKATEIEVSPPKGISVAFTVYPDPISKTFPFAEKPLAIYEGTITVKVHLKADKSIEPATQNLSGKLRVQACDDQVCYAPGTLDVSIPLSIK